VFDEVLDHVLRIDRVLRQPLGHLLLVGESGAGKTVLSRFCAWRTGLSVFQIKITRKYTIDSFDDDLRVVMKRTGCEDEKICFIFDESNVLNTAFLERMNSLLASGEIPGLYEGDEYSALMADCRGWATRNNVMFDSEDELFRHFTRNVQKNLHVVFTMNPASGDFDNRAATSPALFNRCVVDWFGDWSRKALSQVGRQFTMHIDVEPTPDNPYDPEPAGWDIVQRLSNGIPDDALDVPAGKPSLHDAVVATMVFIHENVKSAGVLSRSSSSGTAQKTHKFVSPRDYIDFIHHVVSLHSEKRSQLEEQQLHLNIGLDKLADTATQVAALQQGLSEKEALLSRKDKEANEKLQQMVQEQNVAEQQKREAQELKIELDKRNAEVDKRRAVVEADLAKAEPALKEAQAAVRGIKKSQLDEIRALARPPVAVRLTMEAVCMMINPERVKDHSWRAVRSDMRGAHFKRTVEEFESEDITPQVRKIIKNNYIEGKFSESFNYDKVHKASHATGPLFQWIVSQIDYSEIKERIAPLRDEVEKLAEESKDLVERHEEVEASIVQLEFSIAQYKVEYAELIKETEAIKGEMDTVMQKCTRAQTLLGSLSEERERWEAGSATFQAQLATLLGDVLLAAAFVSYIGFFDHQMRERLLHMWQAHLSYTGIAYKEDLSLVEYLSTPSQRISWSANSLPNDDLCVENAIILSRFNRYPLVIDPSGQAIEYLKRQNASENKRITITSFLDAAFMKQLESALRFGTCLLVQDVENVDPVLNPVLNREFQKTGGRVLVRLGAQDIDFSPSFSMYMTTRDPLFQFTPDICSRVTFVNFTVTPASLTSQCLSKVLRTECPDVDRKRGELLKLQGEYRARLRDLEEKLLEAINSVQGNILDDDTVIHKLEVLKKDAADISTKASASRDVLVEVERTSNAYLPLARMCSKIYFTLDRLGQISFLYQFALNFFLGLMDDVLAESSDRVESNATAEKSGSGPAGAEHLAQRVFQESFTRCARGLLNQDKLLLALRFAQIRTVGTPDEIPTELLQSIFSGSALNGVDEARSRAAKDVSELLVSAMETANADAAISMPVVPLTTAQENDLGNLFRLDALNGIESHMQSNIDDWASFMRSPTAENVVPDSFTDIPPVGSGQVWSCFVDMLVVRVLRPDRFTMSARKWVDTVFDSKLPVQNLEFDLQSVVAKESHSRAPIMLCSRSGFDASSKVDSIAAALGVRYQSLAMGSEEGFQMAEKYVSAAAKNGTWVLLRNVHLCPVYMVKFEKKLHSLAPHDDFRVFLTAEINDKLPTSLLRMSQTFVFEPPAGIKASLTRSLSSIPAARMDQKPAERSRLYFLLAWFHATVIERLQYAPIGWSKRYEFSETDFRCALSSFDDWIDTVAKGRSHVDPEEIPWSALHAMLGQSLYGGRVDNPFDQRLLDAFIEKLFCAASFSASFELAEGVKGPEGTRQEQFLSWVETLSAKNPPTWLGLTPSAEDMLLASVGESVIRKFASMQDATEEQATDETQLDDGSGASSRPGSPRRQRSYASMPSDTEGGGSSSIASSAPAWIQRIATMATSWLESLPEQLALMKRGDSSEDSGALFRCFDREAGTARQLLSVVRGDLQRILAVCLEGEKPTNVTRALMDDLHRGVVPEGWGHYYAYSKAELAVGNWMSDLRRRLDQLASLTSKGAAALDALRGSSTASIWLGGLFYPGAFVAATRQVEAQRLGVSLEELQLEVIVGGGAENGYSITGLALEGGATFDAGALQPSTLMRQLLPDTTFRWQKMETGDDESADAESKKRLGDAVEVPIYLNSTRLNFVLKVELASAVPAQVFATRGTALIAWSML
jgi:dynein heavy chain 1